MTTDKPKDLVEDDGCEPGSEQDPNCDPKLIDVVACRAKGVAAQAAYNATYADALAKARGIASLDA